MLCHVCARLLLEVMECLRHHSRLVVNHHSHIPCAGFKPQNTDMSRICRVQSVSHELSRALRTYSRLLLRWHTHEAAITVIPAGS